MTRRSLGSASSIPRSSLTGTPVSTAQACTARGGEVEPNDWRYWFERAYRAWLARQEQLSLELDA